MFKKQPQGIAGLQTTRQTNQKIDLILNEYTISPKAVIHRYKWTTQGFAAFLTAEQVKKLKTDPQIERVVKDHTYKAFDSFIFIPGPVPGSQITPWGLNRINGPLGYTSNTVWVIGSGIDSTNSDLNINEQLSKSFVYGDNSWDDQNGHGTFVAGIIAAKNNSFGIVGVAPGAAVVAIKICNHEPCSVSDLKAGVEYVAAHFNPGDVANISAGFINDLLRLEVEALENSIIAAADSGLKFVVAAGNDQQSAVYQTPARLNHPNIYTVSAYDKNDNFAAVFPCNPAEGSNYGTPIDYAAPGVNITSLWLNGSTLTACGTSISAPFVAGMLLAASNDVAIDGYVSNDPDGTPDPILIATPLSISISGPRFIKSGVAGTWTVDVFYDNGSITYSWYYKTEDMQGYILDETSTTYTSTSTYTHTFYADPDDMANYSAVRVEVSSGGEHVFENYTVEVQGCEGIIIHNSKGEVDINKVDPLPPCD